MKIICAGMSKTGTKSINEALTQLGYKVYDYPENFYYLGDKWMKIFDGEGTKEDFYDMFKDVDAGCDQPVNLYWEEILNAFPDAKVILMTRDEESWINSLRKQEEVLRNSFALILIQFLTPTGWRLNKYGITLLRIFSGQKPYSIIGKSKINESLMIRAYRSHNATVLQRCPKENLLVYNCKSGWDPLCKFLDVPVPEKPFPHKNVRGNYVEEVMAKHPLFQQINKELKISMSLISLTLVAASIYGISKTNLWAQFKISVLNFSSKFIN